MKILAQVTINSYCICTKDNRENDKHIVPQHVRKTLLDTTLFAKRPKEKRDPLKKAQKLAVSIYELS